MRVAFVTQWFPPESGAVVAAAIAEGLASQGHDVHVLTGFPNYPTGRLQPGYRLKPYRQDRYSENVTVHRAPLYPSHDGVALRRALNYVSFAVSASWVARRRVPRPDVWLTYSSPVTSALPALTAPRRLRAPSCLLIEDLWPDSVTESGFISGWAGRAVEKVLHRFCNWAYRSAATIGVISPSMTDILIERGVERDKIELVPNWVDDSYLLPGTASTDALRRSLGLPLGRLFMYAGNMGELQGLGPLVDAFGEIPDANLVMVGDGVAREELQRTVRERRMVNVSFVPSQPVERVGEFIAASDVQIVSLRDSRLLRATTPSKLQSVMAAARPVLAVAGGDVFNLVTDTECGIAVTPGDEVALHNAINRLMGASIDELAEMGKRGRSYFEGAFSPEVGVSRLESLIRETRARKGSNDGI